MEEFESWKLSEEEASMIEFLYKEKVPSIGDAAYLWKKKKNSSVHVVLLGERIIIQRRPVLGQLRTT